MCKTRTAYIYAYVKLELHITAPAKDRDVGSLVPVGEKRSISSWTYFTASFSELHGNLSPILGKWTLDSLDVMVSKRC